MDSWNNIVVHFVEFEDAFPKAMQELILKAVKVWQELDAAFAKLSEIVERECIVCSIVKAGLGGFIEENAYIGDESERLSPREYGERLSWGRRGRPYKLCKQTYIPIFKRNLPYHRRAY